MDFAIAPISRAALPPGARPSGASEFEAGSDWAVLWLQDCRGVEVPQRLARFGHRSHAEAFLADLLASAAGRKAVVTPEGGG